MKKVICIVSGILLAVAAAGAIAYAVTTIVKHKRLGGCSCGCGCEPHNDFAD